MADPLVLEGECLLSQYEGGFTPPSVSIDCVRIDRALLLWAFGALPEHDRGGSVDDDRSSIGQIRITVERM